MHWKDAENLTMQYNYGDISPSDKKVVEEVIKLAKQQNLDVFAEFLKHKFEIEETPEYDMSQSKFFKIAAKLGLFGSQQGHITYPEDPTKTKYPVMGMTEDVRKFEDLYNAIKEDE